MTVSGIGPGRKSDPALPFFRATLATALRRELLSRGLLPLRRKRVLDLGCGAGNWLGTFTGWSDRSSVIGLDRSPERVRLAAITAPSACIIQADASALPLADQSVDVVSQFTLFTSVLGDEDRAAMANEILRVLRPGGLLIWYDFFAWNPLNARTRPIRKPEILARFPHCRVTFRRVTLAPPLARASLRVSLSLAQRLDRFPLLRTHYLAMIERPAD